MIVYTPDGRWFNSIYRLTLSCIQDEDERMQAYPCKTDTGVLHLTDSRLWILESYNAFSNSSTSFRVISESRARELARVEGWPFRDDHEKVLPLAERELREDG